MADDNWPGFELHKYRPKITFEHENIRMENISNAR